MNKRIISTSEKTDLQPSKTQQKKTMLALQELGEALVELSNKDLQKIPLDESLKESILQAQNMTANSARKRQLQHIGKLMRTADASSIQQAYEKILRPSQENNKLFQQLEQLRVQLLAEGEAALPSILARYPHANRQQLRQHTRAAQKEYSEGKTTIQQRKLFRYLRELHANAAQQ